MSVRATNLRRTSGEHFQPDDPADAKAQRHLRGALEQIDYAAFAANKEVMGATLRHASLGHFQRLGKAVAQARALWTATALAMSESGRAPSAGEVAELGRLRTAYEELAAAYDGLRRMVERGYLTYSAP